MSAINMKGAIFAILNNKGYYDLYDNTGEKLSMRVKTMRITQNAGEVDTLVLVCPVNVVGNKEEMQNLINP